MPLAITATGRAIGRTRRRGDETFTTGTCVEYSSPTVGCDLGTLYIPSLRKFLSYNNLNCGVENGEFEVMSVHKCVHRYIIMQIRRVKDRVTTRRRKAVRNVKKINHNAETKSTKTLSRSLRIRQPILVRKTRKKKK